MSIADELRNLHALMAEGVLTEAEFLQEKARVLASTRPAEGTAMGAFQPQSASAPPAEPAIPAAPSQARTEPPTAPPQVRHARPRRSNGWLWGIVTVFGLLGIGLLAFALAGDQDEAKTSDELYLTGRQASTGKVVPDPGRWLDAGHVACAALDDTTPVEYVVADLLRSGFTADEAPAVLGPSIVNFCPQHEQTLRDANAGLQTES